MTTITIRLKDDEKAKLEAAAQRADMTLSEYVRSMLSVRQELIESIEARLSRLELNA